MGLVELLAAVVEHNMSIVTVGVERHSDGGVTVTVVAVDDGRRIKQSGSGDTRTAAVEDLYQQMFPVEE